METVTESKHFFKYRLLREDLHAQTDCWKPL